MRSRPLRIAVASGKGGTGKTTVAVNLAAALAAAETAVAYVDCDVEEPNGHLFLSPTDLRREVVTVQVPEVDPRRCNLCGACGSACRFSAILALPEEVLTFPQLCHSCGGCVIACPERAIREVPRAVGVVEEGCAGSVAFVHGKLDVGVPMAPPVIRAVLDAAPTDRVVVMDAPPGTSCPVMAAVRDADVVLLVTEPTPFGLNDLKLAVSMVRALGVPLGVVVNRVGIGDESVRSYCARESIPVLMEIPNDRGVAEAYSRGGLALQVLPDSHQQLMALYARLCETARLFPVPPEGGGAERNTAPAVGGPPPSERVGATAGQDLLTEIVVISGKGGTGKTSVVASLFALAHNAVVVDCDVDAADLHLVLCTPPLSPGAGREGPALRERRPFVGGSVATVAEAMCTGCGICIARCRFGAIRPESDTVEVDGLACEGCGVCVDHCPVGALDLQPSVNGEWFVSETRHGPLVHARLGVAQENSGKLVSLVRREGRAVAAERGREFVICDGSPGIGCPVIASITGASMALIVTEPTLSGLHDLTRVAELCRQLGVPAAVAVNKADINPDVTAEIEAEAGRWDIPVLGRICYDEAVTAAQVKRSAVVEGDDGQGRGKAAEEHRALAEAVFERLGLTPPTIIVGSF